MTTQEAWTTYNTDVKRFIMSKVKNTSLTDDILQDTFIKVHTSLHKLKDTTKLKSWILTIARNSTIDFLKRNKQTIDTDFFYIVEEEETHNHTKKDCLEGILKNLPKKYQTPLFLSDIKGLKQEEVAQQLNQSLSTTKSQIQRGRKLIAQGFMDCCGFVLNKEGKLIGEIQEKVNCKVCN